LPCRCYGLPPPPPPLLLLLPGKSRNC
jgi:hypothetical protein